MEEKEISSEDKPYTVAEFCSYLRIGRNKGYEIVAKKEIRHIRVGNKIRIPKLYLEEYISAITV